MSNKEEYNIDDNQLIKEILKGDTDKYEILMRKHSKKLYGYIFKLVKDKYAAEEILQETFIKAYRSLRTYDKRKEFSPWIFKIARNNVLNYFEDLKKNSTFEFDENIDSNNAESINQDPEKVIEKKEEHEMIDEVINSLPEKYRSLIILKYFDELNYDEISQRMNIPKDKVRWRLHQARKRMAKEFTRLQKIEKGGEVYEV